MDKQEILNFLNENPIFYLATVEGSQPRVRGILLHKADSTGLSFTTGKMRDVYKQLIGNNKVELCFHKEQFQIRVTGIAVECDDDLELKKEIVAVRPFMKPWIEKDGYQPMAVFRITNCQATLWNLKDTLKPKTYIQLSNK